jgi:hypothetical protein
MNSHVALEHFTILALYQAWRPFTSMETSNNIFLKRGRLNQLDNPLLFFSIMEALTKK